MPHCSSTSTNLFIQSIGNKSACAIDLLANFNALRDNDVDINTAAGNHTVLAYVRIITFGGFDHTIDIQHFAFSSELKKLLRHKERLETTFLLLVLTPNQDCNHFIFLVWIECTYSVHRVTVVLPFKQMMQAWNHCQYLNRAQWFGSAITWICSNKIVRMICLHFHSIGMWGIWSFLTEQMFHFLHTWTSSHTEWMCLCPHHHNAWKIHSFYDKFDWQRFSKVYKYRVCFHYTHSFASIFLSSSKFRLIELSTIRKISSKWRQLCWLRCWLLHWSR